MALIKHILYITGSLRESCIILTKGFNKEFLPACLTEHPVHYLVHFSVGISVKSYAGCWIHAVFLAEILGCCDLLLNGREKVRNIYIHLCHNNSKNMYRFCSNIYIYIYLCVCVCVCVCVFCSYIYIFNYIYMCVCVRVCVCVQDCETDNCGTI